MLKLIVVDDEKVTRESLQQYIPWNELGIGSVETAKNGLVALELAQQMKPDIIITDVRMPKMDGIEFATKVREVLPDTKIIFLSGYSDKEYLKSAIHLKAISYIEKPVNIKEMMSIVKDTAELCRQESEKKAETEKLKSILAESIPLLSQEIAEELVKENADILPDSCINAILFRNEPKEVIDRKTYEIKKFIRDHYANKKLSIQMIAENTYLSKTYLCSFFKKSTGKTLNEYITEIRIEKARELLRENRVKLYEIASDTGFNDSNYFSAIFKKVVGCTPSEYREKNYL